MTRADGLVLRRAGPDEDEGVRAVIAAAFPDNPKSRAEITRWQYWDNPFGPTRVWVWDDAGTVVATYAAYPVPVVVMGRRGIAGVGVDAAVAPTHQGRGLFTPLSKALYADAAAHGMPLTICYPNANSTAGITKAGWLPVARLRTLVLPFDDAWLAGRFSLPTPVARAARVAAFRVRGTGGLVAREVDGPPEGLDDLWERVAPTVANGVVRDDAWWQWRYAQRPHAPYRCFAVHRGGRLVGAAVTLAREAFGGRFLNVLELLTVDVDAARALTRAIADSAGGAGTGGGAGGGGGAGDGVGGAVGAALVAVPGSALDRLAGRAGFRRLPQRLEPKPLMFGAVRGDPAAPDPTALTWSVAWGDLDHL
ncbi:MAG: GNAT family N-acetyltransferase [Mycobacteriales bacterium]